MSEKDDDDKETSRLNIVSHRALVAKRREIVARIEARPDLASLFFINPVLALKEAGVDLSPEISHHVLESVRHPPATEARRIALEKSLQEALGEPARPSDPHWLARTLFEKLHVKPVKTEGQTPGYIDPVADDKALIASWRPKFTKWTGVTATPPHGTSLTLAPYRPAVRRLDLNAPVPTLPHVEHHPKSVSIEAMWFYKDASPIAHDLFELGVIEGAAFPIHSGDTYRKIKDGTKPNAFRAWIKAVRFGPQ